MTAEIVNLAAYREAIFRGSRGRPDYSSGDWRRAMEELDEIIGPPGGDWPGGNAA